MQVSLLEQRLEQVVPGHLPSDGHEFGSVPRHRPEALVGSLQRFYLAVGDVLVVVSQVL